jgi:hypothetical protein
VPAWLRCLPLRRPSPHHHVPRRLPPSWLNLVKPVARVPVSAGSEAIFSRAVGTFRWTTVGSTRRRRLHR